MNRLVFLRPVSRAIRVQGSAGCNRNLSRAFSTSSCRNFGATGAVNKKKKKNMSMIDAELFGEVEASPAPVTPEEPAKTQPVEADAVETEPKFEGKLESLLEGVPPPRLKAKPAPQLEAKPVQQLETKPAPQLSKTETIKPRKTSFIPGEGEPVVESKPRPTIVDFSSLPPRPEMSKTAVEPKIDLQHYYSSWYSLETREVLSDLRIDRYGFVSAVLQSQPALEVLGRLNAEEEDEFDQRWIHFEMEEGNEDKALLPILEFFLGHGLQILPPTPEAPHPEQCARLINPTTGKEALKMPVSGRWKQMMDQVVKTSSKPIPYPDLMTPDALLDPRDVLEVPPNPENPFHNRVIVRNHRSVFHEYPEGVEDDLLSDDVKLPDEEESSGSMTSALPVSSQYYHNLYQSILMRRTVVQQTGKGKIRRVAFMVLVGDGNGLVGYGEGKHSNGMVALNAARIAAVKNMDWIERFEKRTVWTEMSTKLGATQLILRPRPVGFGLRCNPFLHQILRAAGLKDISAKVWGSRNKLNVIKAAFRMLHAGHAPTGMGDGVGGKGKKLSKGSGVRGKDELERARGRKLINLRN